MSRETDSTRPTSAEGAAARGQPPDPATRYELVRELGRGAMGTVWLARDRALDRDVAIKLLHDRLLSSAHQARMATEARAMARLNHANVVAVYDVGELDGRTFIAMELVRGEPLSSWVSAPRSWREVVRVFEQVARGLAAAHAAGLVHRDVKPSNILLGEDGRPRVADFGVAHVSPIAGNPASTSTDTAGEIGSPAYMPPERLIGDPAGTRGDQFGFATALYEVLHGRRPFVGATSEEIVAAVRRGPPPPTRPVPRWLHAVVSRGLAADPAERFASMDELAAALRAGPRRGAWILAALALLAAVAVVAVLALRRPDRATSPATNPIAPVATVAPSPDAAVDDAAEVTAADASIATEPADARATARTAPPPPPPPTPKVDPTTGLTRDEIWARYRELKAELLAAEARGDLRGARRVAERAIPFGRRMGTVEPHQIIMMMSCRLGDERRARAAFAALPRDAVYLRQEMVSGCRLHGMELGDLLD